MTKPEMLKKFKELYPKKRLLSVQLDGFTHRVVFDGGSRASEVKFDYFSHCMPEGAWSTQASKFFKDIPNSIYQNNAQEYIFVLPNER
jgi:hypothetical protein